MKKIVVLLALICFQYTYSQSIEAKVVDENDQPLVGATVYFDGTTRGVITDLDGVFEIVPPENISKPTLVITYLGYDAIFITNIDDLKEIYQLQPRAESLNAVNIFKSPFSREEMMEVFKTYFLGAGRPAKKCEILNPNDVILYYVVKENTLYAESLNPIVIQNDFLGYNVRFDLQTFEVKYSTQSLDDDDLLESFYFGYSFFEDTNPKKSKVRNKIYFRSINYFFKSLVEDKLDLTNFYVGYDGDLANPETVFEVEPLSKNLYEVFLERRTYEMIDEKFAPTKIVLAYQYDISNILFLKPKIRINSFGNNLDVDNIRLIGELAEHRLAKMLPNNFLPE
jgi:hypothetical protein